MRPRSAVGSLKPYMSPRILPAMAFLTMADLALAAGLSWGIFALSIPIIMPLSYASQADNPRAIGAAGGFGLWRPRLFLR